MSESDHNQIARSSREGVVVRTTGAWHDVEIDGEIVNSRVPGRGRLEEQTTTNPVAVGDRVSVIMNSDGTGQIDSIEARQNRLSRRAAGRRSNLEHVIAANVDQVWIVQAVNRPKFNPGFVDRLLVMAGVSEIPTGILINKIDLIRRDDTRQLVDEWTALYRELGYPVLETCALSGAGVDAWKEELKGKQSVVSGPSGAGKSTLLNAVSPGLEIRTGEVSGKTKKGKHTTAVAVRYAIGPDTFVIDTPGIREIGLWDLAPDELYGYLPEFIEPAQECKFPNCLHDHEPGCGVKQAVDEGEVSEARYVSYLNMLDSLRMGAADVGR